MSSGQLDQHESRIYKIDEDVSTRNQVFAGEKLLFTLLTDALWFRVSPPCMHNLCTMHHTLSPEKFGEFRLTTLHSIKQSSVLLSIVGAKRNGLRPSDF